VDPVLDPLLLRKSGSAGNRTRDLWIRSQKLVPLDHRGGPVNVTYTAYLQLQDTRKCSLSNHSHSEVRTAMPLVQLFDFRKFLSCVSLLMLWLSGFHSVRCRPWGRWNYRGGRQEVRGGRGRRRWAPPSALFANLPLKWLQTRHSGTGNASSSLPIALRIY
jgi:hypothetical protein